MKIITGKRMPRNTIVIIASSWKFVLLWCRIIISLGSIHSKLMCKSKLIIASQPFGFSFHFHYAWLAVFCLAFLALLFWCWNLRWSQTWLQSFGWHNSSQDVFDHFLNVSKNWMLIMRSQRCDSSDKKCSKHPWMFLLSSLFSAGLFSNQVKTSIWHWNIFPIWIFECLLLSGHLTDHLVPAVWEAGLSSKYWVTEGDDVQQRGPFRLAGLAWYIWQAASPVLCCVQTNSGPVKTSFYLLIGLNELCILGVE